MQHAFMCLMHFAITIAGYVPAVVVWNFIVSEIGFLEAKAANLADLLRGCGSCLIMIASCSSSCSSSGFCSAKCAGSVRIILMTLSGSSSLLSVLSLSLSSSYSWLSVSVLVFAISSLSCSSCMCMSSSSTSAGSRSVGI